MRGSPVAGIAIRTSVPCLIVALAGGSCTGQIEAAPDEFAAVPAGDPAAPVAAVNRQLAAKAGARRLTQREYDDTVRDLLGAGLGSSTSLLPEDKLTPFDNDYTIQIPSRALADGSELLATDIARAVMSDPSRRDALVGCKPAGPDDAGCLRQFISAFGRRALRRPLGASDMDQYAALQSLAKQSGDFFSAVEAVIRAFLLDPEFLYRIEIGTPVPGEAGLFKLNNWERGTRLSYLLLGSAPPDWMLDLADAGKLGTPAEVRAAASRLLAQPQGFNRIDRFHALWLGYDSGRVPGALGTAMRNESSAVVERVIVEKQRPWQDLLRWDETFIDDALANHYHLPAPGSGTPVWTKYGKSGRRGLLSHGSFLSLGAFAGDSSPTQRGVAIRGLLFCQPKNPPPPGVMTDVPPQGKPGACKGDRYAAHRQGGCAVCHNLYDPVGFGLENYDIEGSYRTTEKGAPNCPIKGDGELVGIGTFHGPGEMGDLLLTSGVFNQCATTQLYRFATGRSALEDNDKQVVQALLATLGTGDFRLQDLLLDLVSTETFGHLRMED